MSWWRHQMETFSALLALCAGNSPVPVNSPHKGQWRGALMFSLICAWINDRVNNCEAGDMRRQRGHCDVIVMVPCHHVSIKRKPWTHDLFTVIIIGHSTVWSRYFSLSRLTTNLDTINAESNFMCWYFVVLTSFIWYAFSKLYEYQVHRWIYEYENSVINNCW